MAEKMKCLLCGFETVRCGISNHVKHAHPKRWLGANGILSNDIVTSLGFETKEERMARKEKKGV